MPTEKQMSQVIKILKKNRGRFIVPALTEIAEEKDPFKVLVSCILSLRTRDATTARVSRELYKIADTPRKIASMNLKKLSAVIKPVNYYKTKAKRIKNISERLVREFDSSVPNDIDTLMKFKGVGRKTANIVVVYGFNSHGIPVDTHVHRVSNRLGWVETNTPEKTEVELRKILPRKYWIDLNDLFVQFGQNICMP
ncbi:MAG TPA: endonuclease III, partial [archaeon]|nr:endonuclease III [archaeon]